MSENMAGSAEGTSPLSAFGPVVYSPLWALWVLSIGTCEFSASAARAPRCIPSLGTRTVNLIATLCGVGEVGGWVGQVEPLIHQVCMFGKIRSVPRSALAAPSPLIPRAGLSLSGSLRYPSTRTVLHHSEHTENSC